MSQLRWDKPLFIQRYFFFLDFLVLRCLISEQLKCGLALLEGMHQGKERSRLAYQCQDCKWYYLTSAHLAIDDTCLGHH